MFFKNLKIFEKIENHDLRDTLFHTKQITKIVVTSLCVADEVKLQLAQSGVMTDRLLPLLHSCARAAESSDQEDSQQTEKLASDLLVLLLTGDRSMEALYDGGAGQVYKQSLNWLISPREHLRVCGALAIGNFARNGGCSPHFRSLWGGNCGSEWKFYETVMWDCNVRL